jgi:hypothetical protein
MTLGGTDNPGGFDSAGGTDSADPGGGGSSVDWAGARPTGSVCFARTVLMIVSIITPVLWSMLTWRTVDKSDDS